MPVLKTIPSKTPIHLWTNDIELEAELQLKKLGTLPFLFHHVAVMPDAHSGRGSTIGTVMATQGAIIPAAVGVDIGCGMVAVKTSLSAVQLDGKLQTLRRKIEEAIPVGFDENSGLSSALHGSPLWENWNDLTYSISKDDRLRKKAMNQCGSLGGGNHFIEVSLDKNQDVWILLHSGSRHIGKVLADCHIQNARGQMRSALESLPDRDLASLKEGSEEFTSYIHDLLWAQSYAYQNREEMIRRVMNIFYELFGDKFSVEMKVNCHHNYAQEEEHFGKRVWVTRKGAVSAKMGELGIIPGSMGTKSYIVRGLGNAQSFMSCSHGAGRRMSRTQAKKIFSKEDLEKQTAGVECRKDRGVIDEIPGAYKNIDEVMKNQSDLVEVVAEIKQVLCVKG